MIINATTPVVYHHRHHQKHKARLMYGFYTSVQVSICNVKNKIYFRRGKKREISKDNQVWKSVSIILLKFRRMKKDTRYNSIPSLSICNVVYSIQYTL